MLNKLQTILDRHVPLAQQEEYKSKVKQLRSDVEKAFTEHPEKTGETYLQHLWFTVKMSGRFATALLAILAHGLFPFLFMRTSSSQIEQVYRIMKSRIPEKRREEIDQEIRLPVRTALHSGESTVAIVGGGFSGALVLTNLVNRASGNLTIEWFESGDSLGTGIAYETKDYAHLLNVRAERMGALAGKPDDFYQWLQTEEGKNAVQVICPGKPVGKESFLPRALYAEYLRHIIKQGLAAARDKGIAVRIHRSNVVDASLHDATTQQIKLLAEQDGLLQETIADAVVLATGNLPPRHFHFQTGLIGGARHYVANVWDLPEDHIFPAHVHELSADDEIVIIGTGLTMVDTVLTLKSRGYKGTITAISRNGLLPASHADSKPYPAWDWVLAPQFAPRTALGLFKRLREEIARAEEQDYDWRSVVDSIRPATQQLWRQLSTNEKRKFLNRLFTLWNIHRHRMAPEIHAELKSMQQSGALKIIAGKIYYVGSDKDGLTVAYRKRGTNRVETLRPTLVINCTGPEYDIASSNHKLLRNLRDREMITVGPLRVGIEATRNGTAKGRAAESLFPVGTLLVGELLECTAVPELREQAQETAEKVLHRIAHLYETDRNAALAVAQWI